MLTGFYSLLGFMYFVHISMRVLRDQVQSHELICIVKSMECMSSNNPYKGKKFKETFRDIKITMTAP